MREIKEKLKKEEEILTNFKILNWNSHKFSYDPMDTSYFKSVFTNDNLHF